MLTECVLPLQPNNPLSMLFGRGGGVELQTVGEYDRSELQSMRSIFQMGVVFTLFLHLKLGMVMPLVYQAVSMLCDLYFHPLVQAS